MRTSKVLASALQLLMSVKLMALGVFLIALSLLPYARSLFLDFLHTQPEFFSIAGYATLGVGILLFIAFYAINRGQYYQVSMQGPVAVDLPVIEKYMKTYWRQHFPHENIETEVVLHDNQKIELITQMPSITFPDQKAFLEKAEKELGTLLAENLGYDRQFLVTIITK